MNDDEASDRVRSGRQSGRRIITKLCIYVIIVLLCVFVIPEYIIQRAVVKGTSMEDTLHNNESLLVDKLSYHFTDPERYDIIVFYPHVKKSNEYYVKRVIGLPGETVQIKDSGIYINGSLINDNYGKAPITYPGIAKEPITLSEDEYFVLGDNRQSSFDSRYSNIGPVSRSNIVGEVRFRILPVNRFGPVN